MEQGKWERIPFYKGFDFEMRPWVSNVIYILGGFDAQDVMGFILNNLLENLGQIVAWAAEVSIMIREDTRGQIGDTRYTYNVVIWRERPEPTNGTRTLRTGLMRVGRGR